MLRERVVNGMKVLNPIHLANRLGQQWIVDQYYKKLSADLRFIEMNQKTLHAELYSGCSDAVNAGDVLNKTGRPVIVPASVTGSDRYYKTKFMDAMAICARMGRPHIFVTMTANPKWPEIQARLKKGQSHNDRPDIVSSVFDAKHKELMKDFKDGRFGDHAAHVYSIEFQKSGLPHAHILIWFQDKDAWLKPETIDKVISAEIPDESSPIYNRVISSMLHGPCGSPEDGERSCCAGDGTCRFNYPFPYQSKTSIQEDGYALLRRRSPDDGGRTCTKVKTVHGTRKDIIYTNRDVVPYSPWLLQKYDCHINVEYVHSVSTIKYVFSYIKKGCDMATVSIQQTDSSDAENPQPINEVEDFFSKRCISSIEASWRIQENDITGRFPAVLPLPVHLPKQQTVYFDPTSTEDDIKEKLDKNGRTMLTEYFRMCEYDVDGARNLYYREMPEYFTWQKTQRMWQLRKRINKDQPSMIGRMHLASMSDHERFALRVLLNHTKGARSFDHLKTLDDDDGTICGTFMQACIAKNLLSDDHYFIDCMREQALYSTNVHQLRELFVDILTACEVVNPLELYER